MVPNRYTFYFSFLNLVIKILNGTKNKNPAQ